MLRCHVPHSAPLIFLGSFNRETSRAYAKTELFNDHGQFFSYNLTAKKKDFVVRYLLERPYTANMPTNGNLAALIDYVVDELVKHDDDGAPEQLRYQYMKTLCRCGSLVTFFPKTRRPVSSVENRYHVFIAAIYLEKFSVVRCMLEDGQMNVAEVKSEFFGTPLYAALQMRNRELVGVLLQRGADVNMERPGTSGPPLEAAIESHDEETVRLLLEPRYGHSTSGTAFESGIVRSLHTGQPGVAHLLFERFESKLSECRYILCEGLRAACRQGMIDIVQLLLDNGGDVNENHSSDRSCFATSPVEQATWTGQEEVLRLLLARGANPYGRDSGSWSMYAAVWGGHIGTARILLDAGVQLEPRRWMTVLVIAAQRVGSAELARLLLDRGIIEAYKLDKGPQEAESFIVELMGLACQQGNVGFVQGLAQHGVALNDVSLYARHECPPPIVIAMAFRQDHLVRVLRELEAIEVDPLDTIWGEAFANGKYPCDPPDPPECKMPHSVTFH